MRRRWVSSIDDDARCHALRSSDRVGGPHHLLCAGQVRSRSDSGCARAYKSRGQDQRDGSQDSVALQHRLLALLNPVHRRAYVSRWSLFWATRAAWSI